MAEGRYDIRVSQRAAYSEVFAYREDDETTVIPLTGATAIAQIRKKPGDQNLLGTFAVTINGSAGELTLALNGAQTAALPIGTFEYDVLLTLNSKPIIFLEGKVKVDGTVSVPA